jgi:hypothetical protein
LYLEWRVIAFAVPQSFEATFVKDYDDYLGILEQHNMEGKDDHLAVLGIDGC